MNQQQNRITDQPNTMKLKTIILVTFLIISLNVFCQQIADGRAIGIDNFSVPLKSGGYQGYNPIGGNPDLGFGWQHLFIVRHSNDANNYQLQLSSSFASNDRLFFRKLASGDLGSTNPTWFELATRGSNTFFGNQTVDGNQNITGNLLVGKDSETTIISGPANSGAIQIKTNSAFAGSENRYLRLGWKDNNFNFLPTLSINEDLNVGIGTTTPDSKLTVNGAIHATEVKVTQTVPADYVFEKYYLGKSSLKPNYTLSTLSEVEKFTKENHHLPNVPSAKEIQENGIQLGEMSNVLLQKIEEMTLYIIEQNKELELQRKENTIQSKKIEVLEKENEVFKSLSERLSKLENQSKH